MVPVAGDVLMRDVLVHKDTPEAPALKRLLTDFRLKQFNTIEECRTHRGLIIAGLGLIRQMDSDSLQRSLMICGSVDVGSLRSDSFFARGLCDALVLPINNDYFIAKVEQCAARVRDAAGARFLIELEAAIDGRLSPKESEILRMLFLNGRRGVSRAEFANRLWSGVAVLQNTLDTHLFNLRSKLEKIGISIVWFRRGSCWRIESTNPAFKLS